MQVIVKDNPIFGGYLIIMLACCILPTVCYPPLSMSVMFLSLFIFILPALMILMKRPAYKHQQTTSWLRTLAILVGSQIGFLLLFICTCYGIKISNPHTTPSLLPTLMAQSHYSILLPGIMYAVMTFFFYQVQHDKRPLTVLSLWPTQSITIPQLVFDFSTRISNSLSIVLSLFAMVSILINLFGKPWLPRLQGELSIPHMLMGTSMLACLFIPPCKHYLNRQMKNNRSFANILLQVMSLITVVLIATMVLFDGFHSKSILFEWNRQYDQAIWSLVSIAWWLGLARCYAGMIVKSCKQDPVLVFLSMLILPGLLTYLAFNQPQLLQHVLSGIVDHMARIAPLIFILAGLCLFLFPISIWFILGSELDNSHTRKKPRKQAVRWFLIFMTLSFTCLLTGLRVFSFLTGVSITFSLFLSIVLLRNAVSLKREDPLLT